MLFYVQMRWKIDPPHTLDEFWKLEAQEIETALQTIREKKVVGLWKVAGQPLVIGVVNMDSIEELDRTIMARLPLRNYLDFEVIWAVRDYEDFAIDVRKNYEIEKFPAAHFSPPQP